MALDVRKLRVGVHERSPHLPTITAQAPLELSDSPCDMTRHGRRPLPIRACEVRRGGDTALPGVAGTYSSLTGMMVPLAAGVFGSVTTSNPFLNVAVTLLPSTAIGSRTPRRNAP